MHPDQREYRKYTGPQVAERAASTLAGLVKGIEFDRKLKGGEKEALLAWCDQYKEFENRAPYKDLIPHVKELALSDAPDKELVEDIAWVCSVSN